jgi:peptidoglycan hydrolase CwlO-like protein
VKELSQKAESAEFGTAVAAAKAELEQGQQALARQIETLEVFLVRLDAGIRSLTDEVEGLRERKSYRPWGAAAAVAAAAALVGIAWALSQLYS